MSATVVWRFTRALAWFQDPNPILVKELRSTFRSKAFIRFLYLSTGLMAFLVMSSAAAIAAGPVPPAAVGELVFQTFFFGGGLVASLAAPTYASAAITGERELGTYESLLLTGMTPWRIVWGKFLAVFSSVALVLIAYSPVVGISFLFGGVALSHVLLGYLSLLFMVAFGVALGLALSAHMRSTRVGVLLVLGLVLPLGFASTVAMWAFGEAARAGWGTTMEGPFWFVDALASRLFEADTFFLLVVLPVSLFGTAIWFLLAAAVAGLRPAGEDRSTPFKVWSVVSLLGLVGIVGAVPNIAPSAVAETGLAAVLFAAPMFLFYGLLLMNERLIPSHAVRVRIDRRPWPLCALLRLFGPGAAPTARFAAVFLALGSILCSLSPALTRHFYFPHLPAHAVHDAALVIAAVGNGTFAIFFAMLGITLRTAVPSGIATRLISVGILVALGTVPFLIQLVVDLDALDRLDRVVPPILMLTPSLPSMLAVKVSEGSRIAHRSLVVVTVVIYGGLALLMWIGVETRAARARRRVVEDSDAEKAQFFSKVP